MSNSSVPGQAHIRAIDVRELGTPEVLTITNVPIPVPPAHEVLVRTAAIGVNFIDIYYRTEAYQQPLPFIPGDEGAGVIVGVGAGVEDLAPGDRVA